MYADTMTDSMRGAIEETNRRRAIQQKYNEEHGITPQTVRKAVRELIAISKKATGRNTGRIEKDYESMSRQELEQLIAAMTRSMHTAAAELDFEKAAELRDEIRKIRTEHLQ